MTERTLSELAHEACILASLAEGLSVLDDQAEGLMHGTQCPMARRAGNALGPAIDVVIERAWALNAAIEKLETAQRRQK